VPPVEIAVGNKDDADGKVFLPIIILRLEIEN